MPAEDDDEAASGPPPDPLDRIWLHPTELSQFEAEALTPGRHRPRPNSWTVAVVSAMAGAVATMAVLLATGALENDDESDAASTAINPAASFAAAAAGTGVVAVQVTVGDRDVRASGVSIGGGDVVTSTHAVRHADHVNVTGTDGLERTAIVVGADRETGVALLLVDAPEWPAVTMDDEVGVGETVVALAAGVSDPWVSEGVVSAVDQAITAREAVYAGFILTDTAADKHARGGALIDQDGNVVGILTAPPGAAPSGLATPIAVAVQVAADLEATGRSLHGWLGVTGSTADEPSGALVHDVAPESPAAQAGLKQGDVIVAVGGDDVSDMAALTSIVRRHEPGETVPIAIVRGGDTLQVDCQLSDGRTSARTTVPTTTAVLPTP
jgi:S1-C subfamily serine protease